MPCPEISLKHSFSVALELTLWGQQLEGQGAVEAALTRLDHTLDLLKPVLERKMARLKE